MWTVTSPRLSKPPTLDGLLSVGGYLAVCCALVAAVATVADWRADQRHETWRRATAVVEWCNVASVHSRIRNAGGREWHLECSARLDAGGQTSPVRVRSHSVKRASDVRKIEAWAKRHGKGTHLAVRFDPDQPRSVIAEPSTMPCTGPRAADDVVLVELFGAGGVLFLLAGAWRRRRGRRATLATAPSA